MEDIEQLQGLLKFGGQLLDFGKQNGLASVVMLFNLWVYVINPRRKKNKGTYVSYQYIDETLKKLEGENKTLRIEIDAMRRVMNNQIEKEVSKEVILDAMKARQNQVEATMQGANYLMQSVDANLKTNNALLGRLKDFLGTLEGPTT